MKPLYFYILLNLFKRQCLFFKICYLFLVLAILEHVLNKTFGIA